MATSPKLGATLLQEGGQKNAEALVNEQHLRVDVAIGSYRLKTFENNTPPGSPANGDCHLTGASPTGAWATQANKFAFYYNGWRFWARHACTAYREDTNVFVMFDPEQSLWVPLQQTAMPTTADGEWTGQYGIGGEKRYRKAVQIAALPNAAQGSFSHGIDSSGSGSIDFGSAKDPYFEIFSAYRGAAGQEVMAPLWPSLGSVLYWADKSFIWVATSFNASAFRALAILNYAKVP